MVKISILIHGVQVLAHVCLLSSITAGKSNSIQIPTKIDPFFTVNFIVLGHRTQINTFQTFFNILLSIANLANKIVGGNPAEKVECT